MTTITRERVAEIIHAAGLEPCDYEEVFGSIKTGEIVAMARIALASLEAEPVCYLTWHQGFSAPDDCEEYFVEAKLGDKSCDGSPAFPVYAAPPAPVSVPDALTDDIDSDDHPLLWSYNKGWNACRAAMLQGKADGALTNDDTKRVDELVMWIKRLANSLRKANPDSKLQSDAMDYLNWNGLIGVEDILR